MTSDGPLPPGIGHNGGPPLYASDECPCGCGSPSTAAIRAMVGEVFVPSFATASTGEADPTGRSPREPGAKLDAGKSPVLRGALGYFPRALMAVADVSAFGARKYAWKGWQTVPDGVARYGDALARHLLLEAADGPNDADSGLMHAAHAAWNALARLELMLTGSTKSAS